MSLSGVCELQGRPFKLLVKEFIILNLQDNNANIVHVLFSVDAHLHLNALSSQYKSFNHDLFS